jgi:hypothetical protein
VTTTPNLAGEAAGATETFPQLRAPYGKSPSVRPALVVLACAVALTLGGVAVALIGSGQTTPATVVGLGSRVPGVSLAAIGATQVLKRISNDGVPPEDVLRALVVPKGARIISTTDEDADIDQFDRSVYLEVDTTSAQLVKFYKVELKRAHWSFLGEYSVPNAGNGARELLADRAGSDGYEWEVGLVVTPVNPTISPALAGSGQTSPTMGLRLRLFEVPDGGS